MNVWGVFQILERIFKDSFDLLVWVFCSRFLKLTWSSFLMIFSCETGELLSLFLLRSTQSLIELLFYGSLWFGWIFAEGNLGEIWGSFCELQSSFWRFTRTVSFFAWIFFLFHRNFSLSTSFFCETIFRFFPILGSFLHHKKIF